MIFEADDLRVGRAVATGEYSLPITQFAVILAYACAPPRPRAASADDEEDLAAALLDRCLAELVLIDPELVDEIRRTDAPMHPSWILRAVEHITASTTNQQEKRKSP